MPPNSPSAYCLEKWRRIRDNQNNQHTHTQTTTSTPKRCRIQYPATTVHICTLNRTAQSKHPYSTHNARFTRLGSIFFAWFLFQILNFRDTSKHCVKCKFGSHHNDLIPGVDNAADNQAETILLVVSVCEDFLPSTVNVIVNTLNDNTLWSGLFSTNSRAILVVVVRLYLNSFVNTSGLLLASSWYSRANSSHGQRCWPNDFAVSTHFANIMFFLPFLCFGKKTSTFWL